MLLSLLIVLSHFLNQFSHQMRVISMIILKMIIRNKLSYFTLCVKHGNCIYMDMNKINNNIDNNTKNHSQHK